MAMHPRFQWLCDRFQALPHACMIDLCRQVWRTWFWMAHYNSASPKRTTLWSNNKAISRFWLGKLTKTDRAEIKRKHPDFKTVVKYIDKSGRRGYHGTKQLKSTQRLDCNRSCMSCLRTYTREFAKKMSEIYPDMVGTDGLPQPPAADHELLEIFRDPDMGDQWEDADLRSVAKYLLGARGLAVPPQFEACMPKFL